MNHKITNSVITDSGVQQSGSRYEVGTSGTVIDQTVAVGSGLALPVAWTLAGLQSILMVCDKGCVVKINSAAAPDATITLQPGSPYLWNRSDGYYAYPFGSSSSVTNLYLTTTSAVRFQALILGA